MGTNLDSTPYAIGTSNNGSSWSRQHPPPNAVDLTGISCSSYVDCIAVGSSGNPGAGSTIMGTITGGLSWTAQNPPPGIGTVNAVSCPSPADCFAAGVDAVLSTQNAGHAWAPEPIPSEVSGLNGISCPTTTDCTAVGFGIFGSAVIVGTADGGATWTAETVPSGVGDLTAISCVDSSTCQAVSDYSTGSGLPSIIVTTDGGTRWSSERFPATVTDFSGISCVDPLRCTAVGSSSNGPGATILNTTDGGGHWLPQSVPAGIATLDGISCSSATTCLATGSQVISTNDGGSHWNDLGAPTGATHLLAVSCSDSSTCTAVGRTDIVRTTDGGQSWVAQDVPSDVGSLAGVSCAGPANCEAVGAGSRSGGTIETLLAPPAVTTTTLTIGTIGVRYTASLGAAGGLAPYVWSVSGGALPPGLSLLPDGTLSGIPIISGEYTVTLTATDANLLSGSAVLEIPIRPIASPGYWEVASDGGIFSYGGAQFYGSTGSLHLNAPIVGMAATPDDAGYWLLASDGGIFSFGDAVFYGSTGGMHLNAPIVAMAPTPDGGGYWLVASDGGIFAYGDANFYGSTGGTALDRPIVGMAATTDGLGYWLVASDGGIFSYGDAGFDGSTGGLPLQEPIVAMTAAPDGGGYWLVAADGGIFNFGDVSYYGSTGGTPLRAPDRRHGPDRRRPRVLHGGAGRRDLRLRRCWVLRVSGRNDLEPARRRHGRDPIPVGSGMRPAGVMPSPRSRPRDGPLRPRPPGQPGTPFVHTLAGAGARHDDLSRRVHRGQIGQEQVRVEVEVREQVHLVDHDGLRRPEHHRVLQRLLFALGHGEHHRPGVLTDPELGRTDEIAHVLDDQQVEVGQWKAIHAGPHHHRIEMALPAEAGTRVHDGDGGRSGTLEAVGVKGRRDVALQDADAQRLAQAPPASSAAGSSSRRPGTT